MSQIFNPHNKILCHLDKVDELLNNKNPSPVTMEIDPSNACNHSCPFCISGHLHLDKYEDQPVEYSDNNYKLWHKAMKQLIHELKTNVKGVD